jgi:erythromycin esterase-like protein
LHHRSTGRLQVADIFMSKETLQKLIDIIDNLISPIKDKDESYDALLNDIGDAHFVLLGEASHGTHEFYQARIKITERLIKEHGFMAVAIEGDWPAAYGVHRYLQGAGGFENSEHALDGFQNFPTWMWRNTTIPPFLAQLRKYNDTLTIQHKIGFYGLDLYSLHASMQAVIDFLEKTDPPAAVRAKERYACFDHVNLDPQNYGYLASVGVKKSCVNEATAELVELQHAAFEYLKKDGIATEDEYFFAAQNARLVKNAEQYYRSMFEGHISSWNIRDRHMAETLNVLANHLEKRFNKPAKIVIWAHNSHVGDARATEMGESGEVNIGQLMREEHGTDVYSVGFSTYTGTVTAASNWGDPPQQKKITPGFPGSYEELFHHAKYKNFLLQLRGDANVEHFLQLSRLQRAIGVVYRPETERASHYFFTHLPHQFDSIIHFDTTSALRPL